MNLSWIIIKWIPGTPVSSQWSTESIPIHNRERWSQFLQPWSQAEAQLEQVWFPSRSGFSQASPLFTNRATSTASAIAPKNALDCAVVNTISGPGVCRVRCRGIRKWSGNEIRRCKGSKMTSNSTDILYLYLQLRTPRLSSRPSIYLKFETD